jgi:hypothetical protein
MTTGCYGGSIFRYQLPDPPSLAMDLDTWDVSFRVREEIGVTKEKYVSFLIFSEGVFRVWCQLNTI